MKQRLLYFLVLSLLTLFFSYGSRVLLNVDELALNVLAESYTGEQIQEVLNIQERWNWLSYCIIPLLMLLKVSVIAVVLSIGCFFFERHIQYKKLFLIVTKAEFIFLFVGVFKTLWFYIFKHDYSLEDLQHFYPMSVLNLIGHKDLRPWFIYPLQVVNVFEIIYWGILAYLLGKGLQVSTDKGMTIVASSYGVGLLIWVAAVMFFTLNVS